MNAVLSQDGKIVIPKELRRRIATKLGRSASCSRRGNEADGFGHFHRANPPPYVGGYIFQTGSESTIFIPSPAL